MDDVISRQAAINGMRFECGINNDGLLFVPFRDIKKHLESLPPAQPEPCDDAVSRTVAKEAFCDYLCGKKFRCDSNHECKVKKIISELPPVSPKQHTGKWNDGVPICPVCGEDKFKDLDADIWADWKPPYCPNCGAKIDKENE